MKKLFKVSIYVIPLFVFAVFAFKTYNAKTDKRYSVIEMANLKLQSISEVQTQSFQPPSISITKHSLFKNKSSKVIPNDVDSIEEEIEKNITNLNNTKVDYLRALHQKKLSILRKNGIEIGSFEQLSPVFKILLSAHLKKSYLDLSIDDLDTEYISLKQVSTFHHFSLSDDFKKLASKDKLEDFFENYEVYEGLYHSQRNIIHTSDRTIGLPNTDINPKDLINTNLES